MIKVAKYVEQNTHNRISFFNSDATVNIVVVAMLNFMQNNNIVFMKFTTCQTYLGRGYIFNIMLIRDA